MNDNRPDYDPAVLGLYCKYLLTGAIAVAIGFAVAGGLLGWAAGTALVTYAKQPREYVPLYAAGLGIIMGALGWLRTFRWKIEAHETLLQMRIEEHLRALRTPRIDDNTRATNESREMSGIGQNYHQ